MTLEYVRFVGYNWCFLVPPLWAMLFSTVRIGVAMDGRYTAHSGRLQGVILVAIMSIAFYFLMDGL